MTSSSASLRLSRAFHRLSSTKSTTIENYEYKSTSKQRDVASSTHCNQLALLRATKCYHSTTGSFHSHPHFIEGNSYDYICLNISNIMLTHKYTQHTQLHMLRNYKISAPPKCNLLNFLPYLLNICRKCKFLIS